jgi:lipoate-protein ligase A
MRGEWRLLDDGITDAHRHFAVEEALVRLVDEGRSRPTLRLRQVRRAVFVGIHQETWSEVDVDYCRANDIKIVRRGNAGGAVYHDVGSFCYSAFFPRALFPQSDEELYRLFAEPVIRTCADYGVMAHFHGVNDVLVGQRKIYGSAQITWYDTFVQSGTFLVNMDFEVMDRALTPPALKFADKPARSVKERVTSLARELGSSVDVEEVKARLAAQFAAVAQVDLVPGNLTPEERGLADELLALKYGTDAWNLGTRRTYGVTVSARARGGVISLSADMEGDTIREARIQGDFLLSDRSLLERLEEALEGCRREKAQRAVRRAAIPEDIKGRVAQLLSEVFQEEG